MKKLLFISCLLFTSANALFAQVIEDGFYYIRNVGSDRYISVLDNDPDNYNIVVSSLVSTQSELPSTAMAGIRTIGDEASVFSSPSCVFFIRHASGNEYDLLAQGSSLYALTGNRMRMTLEASGDNFKIYGKASYNGAVYTGYLADQIGGKEGKTSVRVPLTSSKVKEYGSNVEWSFIPINGADGWLGIKPNAKTDDGYWGSILMGFCFQLSQGMEAYYVSSADNSSFILKQFTGETIPAGMPILIKCLSDDPSENRIQPVTDAIASPADNQLLGEYCALDVSNHHNYKEYDRETMRIVGASNGQVAFVTLDLGDDYLHEGTNLPANKAYLPVSSKANATLLYGGSAISSVKADSSIHSGVYSLSGVRMADDANLRPGIYVKNGKKVVVK